MNFSAENGTLASAKAIPSSADQWFALFARIKHAFITF